MRALSFRRGARESYGLLIEGVVFEAAPGFRDRWPDLRSALTGGVLPELEGALCAEPLDDGSFDYLPVIPVPDKTICVGVNYRPHVEEMGREVPDYPVLFVRFAGSQVGHGEKLTMPSVSSQFDYEGELAVIIGRTADNVTASNAMDYVAGYTCFMDGSVRDWQRHTPQFTAGKNFRASGAIGPALVTTDEIPDVTRLELVTRVNGEAMQSGRISDLIFDIPAMIEYCSAFATLLPGDVIATGTPGGVGAARTPPAWLKPGDLVEVDIGTVGILSNRVGRP